MYNYPVLFYIYLIALICSIFIFILLLGLITHFNRPLFFFFILMQFFNFILHNCYLFHFYFFYLTLIVNSCSLQYLQPEEKRFQALEKKIGKQIDHYKLY